MRLPPQTLAAIAEGRVDLAFRRWERPRVKEGGRQLTAVGVIGFEEVQLVPREAVTDADARRAGFESATALLGFLDRKAAGVRPRRHPRTLASKTTTSRSRKRILPVRERA